MSGERCLLPRDPALYYLFLWLLRPSAHPCKAVSVYWTEYIYSILYLFINRFSRTQGSFGSFVSPLSLYVLITSLIFLVKSLNNSLVAAVNHWTIHSLPPCIPQKFTLSNTHSSRVFTPLYHSLSVPRPSIVTQSVSPSLSQFFTTFFSSLNI